VQYVLQFPNISPEIFSFQLGPLELALRWYALAYIVGLVLAWRWVVVLVNNPNLWLKKKPPMTAKQVEDLLTWVILGVIIGGRLGFVLFYDFGYYLANPLDIPKVWQGGMSFHGGFLGVMTAGLLFARKHKLPIPSVGDCFAVTVAIGLFFGRLANFINAELWGRPTTVPWSVVFPGIRANQCPVDWAGECSRHPSQLYEAGLEGLLLGLIMFWLAHKRGWLKTPGALVGMFLVIYGASRTFIELFRQPDAQFTSPENPLGLVIRFSADINAWGLTMGQVLSIPMIAVGLVILWRTRWVSAKPI
jgi:phosphatidylglycerol---prolipoprotein diacylglyceryl transferase